MRIKRTHSLLLSIACVLPTLSGCPSTKPPVANPPPQQPTASTKPAPTPKPTEPISQTSATPPAGASNETHAVSTEADNSHNSAEPPSKPPAASTEPDSKERILLLATGRPLLIDIILTIDGAPHTAALNKLVDEVLKIADTDGDGRTMWKELCASNRIKYGQFGNLAISDDNSEKQVIDRYDIARDGVVDRTELPRFLTRNAGASRPFSLRGTLNYRGSNRHGSATWRMLDADGNSVIDADERQQAATRLAARDTDDDEIVTVADLNPRLSQPDPDMMMNDRRRRGPDASRLLGDHADWSSIQRAIEQEYAGGRTLRADSSPFPPAVFDQLDTNHDRRLLRGEYERLNNLPADVVVEIAFGTTDPEPADELTSIDPTKSSSDPTDDEEEPSTNQPRSPVLIKLRSLAPELSSVVPAMTSSPGQLTISLGDSLLAIAINDTVVRGNFAAQAQRTLAMFDQNKDGYLEASEIPDSLPGQIGRLEAIDADGDGKAYPAEIAAFLTQQQAGLRAQIHARASDVEDLLFVALDTNHDQRLDSREIQHAPDVLTRLDTNSDGELTPTELPEVLSLVLARGSIENADALFTPPPANLARPDKKAPRWFTAMDANQDGVISRREFLGTQEQFTKLDRDQNNILDLTEIK